MIHLVGCDLTADFVRLVAAQAIEVAAAFVYEVFEHKQCNYYLSWPLLPCPAPADVFKRLGLSPPRGVLLHGPPGCSKTMLARAAATGSKATFIPLSCAQVRCVYCAMGTV